MPAQPTSLPGDVSVVIPTISTEEFFGECLVKWLENDPKEIIVVTIPRDFAMVRRTMAAISRMANASKVRVVTVDQPNKRAQLVRGIRLATGRFVALVDDDTFPVAETTLTHLLAPFEDEDVGAVGGPQQ
jgi:cellulose synthase/poly-beta-1,6-N-acetylglucosamine synthase-like glycosyltransferase